jgi:uncharacterized protein YjbI with pentapeptide repeats
LAAGRIPTASCADLTPELAFGPAVESHLGEGATATFNALEPALASGKSKFVVHAPRCDGGADREDFEAALAGGDAVRFDGWTFHGADLGALDLSRCEFVRCRGAGVDFSSADLAESRFTACDLNNANMRGSALSGGLFEDCKLTGIRVEEAKTFGTVFRRCLMPDAHLRNLSFRRTTLEGIDFTGADLTSVDFRQTVFVDCILREAVVQNAMFAGADLRGADFGGMRIADLAKFRGAKVSVRQAVDIVAGAGLIVE